MDNTSSRSDGADGGAGGKGVNGGAAKPPAETDHTSPMTADGAGNSAMVEALAGLSITVGAEQPSLPSVATILKNHLLNTVNDENEELREKMEWAREVRTSLTTLKIHLGPDNECVVDLANTVVIPDEAFENPEEDEQNEGYTCLIAIPFHEVPSGQLLGKQLMGSLKGAKPIPLSSLKDIVVTRSGHQIGDLVGISPELFVDENGPDPMVYLTEEIAIQGSVRGLGVDDIERFRDGEYGVGTIMDYLRTGVGLPENATFTPYGFRMDITPEILGILDLLRVGRDDSPDSCTQGLDQTEYELARLKIIAAIGGDEAQMKVLEENKALKQLKGALKSMRDVLGTIVFPHSSGTLTLHLKEGWGAMGSGNDDAFWVIDCSEKEDFALEARDLSRYSPTQSGISMMVNPPAMAREPEDGDGSTMDIRLTYHNGTRVYGYYDSSVDLADFPTSSTLVTLDKVVLPLSSCLVKTLSFLGVDLLGDGSDDEREEESVEESDDEESEGGESEE